MTTHLLQHRPAALPRRWLTTPQGPVSYIDPSAQGDTLILPQGTHRPLAPVSWVSEADLRSEPWFLRRASVPFAWTHGGPVTRAFIQIATNAGFVHWNSIVIMKKSLFQEGKDASP